MATLLSFWALAIGAALDGDTRAAMRRKARSAWVLDLLGLLVQGLVVPYVVVVGLGRVYGVIAPGLHGALRMPSWASFALDFVLIDYLYYWNHRLLHTPALFPIHAVHHTAASMDVFVTSRNTLWTSFVIVYGAANSVFAYLLRDPRPYLAAAALTAVLDLWRHSPLGPREGGRLARLLGAFLVLPRDHAWHHGNVPRFGNYGANLVFWDRLHGTYVTGEGTPTIGMPSRLGLVRQLVWPFE